MKRLSKKGESPFLRVRLPKDMLTALRKLAEAKGDECTTSSLVRKILRKYLKSAGKRRKGDRP